MPLGDQLLAVTHARLTSPCQDFCAIAGGVKVANKSYTIQKMTKALLLAAAFRCDVSGECI